MSTGISSVRVLKCHDVGMGFNCLLDNYTCYRELSFNGFIDLKDFVIIIILVQNKNSIGLHVLQHLRGTNLHTKQRDLKYSIFPYKKAERNYK